MGGASLGRAAQLGALAHRLGVAAVRPRGNLADQLNENRSLTASACVRKPGEGAAQESTTCL